jgi:hypothetical protein
MVLAEGLLQVLRGLRISIENVRPHFVQELELISQIFGSLSALVEVSSCWSLKASEKAASVAGHLCALQQQGGIVLRVDTTTRFGTACTAPFATANRYEGTVAHPHLAVMQELNRFSQRLGLEAHLDRIPSPNPCLVCLARERRLFTRSSGAAVFLGSGLRF